MKHWKEPDEKVWFSFIVDGKRIGTIEDSTKCRKGMKRLRNLAGISVVVASDADMMKVGALTELPKRIIDKMQSLYRQSENRFV